MDRKEAMRRLVKLLTDRPDAKIVRHSDDYLRVEFTDIFAHTDDAEFYFTPGDVLVQFRSARRGSSLDWNVNKDRMESLRKALHFTKVPILRNRRRAFLFFESPLDSFGPTTSKVRQTPRATDQQQKHLSLSTTQTLLPSPFSPNPQNMDVLDAEDGPPGDRFDVDPLAKPPEPLRNRYQK